MNIRIKDFKKNELDSRIIEIHYLKNGYSGVYYAGGKEEVSEVIKRMVRERTNE